MTRRRLLGGTALGLVLFAAERTQAMWFRGGAPVPGGAPSITAVTLSNNSFTGGSPSGTVVGAISVTMSSGSFTGTLSLSGTNAASFQIVGSNLETNGVVANGTYSINIVATQGGAGGSPFTQPETITGSSAIQVATLTLVNTSGSTQAAGTISPIFGQAFKKGDVPSGTAPQFLVSGVAQPYSWGCQAYYSDGSLCWAMFMLRTTASVAGNGTLAVGVWNGGSAPAASARTLAEVYAQAILAATTGAGANFGLAGNWNAYCANDANNHAQYVYMDGAAGKVWRIETEFAQTPGGAAHGQLYCYHYVAALTDAAGALGGFRYIARIMQPWYNNDTPAKNWRAFSAIAVEYGAGPTSISLPSIGAARTFTGAAASQTWNSTVANGWYAGAEDGNLIPGYVTVSGGAMDTALSASQLYFAYAVKPGSTTAFTLSTDSITAALVTANGDATGTMTFNPAPTCLHFGSIFTATSAATWNFIQGTGSMAADGTLRTQCDAAYLHATGLIPPLDTSLTGIVDANATWAASYSWNPISSGPILANVGNTGQDPSIGLITNYHSIHFYKQSAGGELVARAIAYAGAFEACAFRDKTTRNLAVLNGGTYTGMPASNTGLYWYPQSPIVAGFTAPPSGNRNFMFFESNTSHKPPFDYYATLVFGGPDFLDLLMEQPNSGSLNFSPTSTPATRNPTVPTPAFNIATAGCGTAGIRSMAWLNRDWQYAAQIAPASYPDGSQLSQYIKDVADANANWPPGIINATYLNAYCTTNGIWLPLANAANTCDFTSGNGFQTAFFTLAMCVAAGGNRQNADAKSWLQQRANWRAHLLTTFGGYHLYTEYDHSGEAPRTFSDDVETPISSDAHWGITAVMAPAISWTTTSPAFTVNSADFAYGYTGPTAGDKWIFDDTAVGGVPGGFSANTPYYVVNVSVNSFDLSATLGGAAILPTGAGSTTTGAGDLGGANGPWTILIAPPAASTGHVPTGTGGADNYLLYGNAQDCYMTALGITGLTACLSDSNTRIAANAIDFTTEPNWKLQSSL